MVLQQSPCYHCTRPDDPLPTTLRWPGTGALQVTSNSTNHLFTLTRQGHLASRHGSPGWYRPPLTVSPMGSGYTTSHRRQLPDPFRSGIWPSSTARHRPKPIARILGLLTGQPSQIGGMYLLPALKQRIISRISVSIATTWRLIRQERLL
jgi:hypothetical protein